MIYNKFNQFIFKEEVTIINKHLNEELEIKSQQLDVANTRITLLTTQLKLAENSFKEINDKYTMLEEAVGNHDAGEFKISILKLKRYEQITSKIQKGNVIKYDSDETRSEIIHLKELLHTLEISNDYNKQSLEKEVERRRLIELEFKNTENVVGTLSATNIKLLHSRDWNKTKIKALFFKQEELLRKNASLQEYSATLREKYETLLLKKKKVKRQKKNEIPESDKKIKSDESVYINEYENNNSQLLDANVIFGSGTEQLSEIIMMNCNEEKEKISKLEKILENMIAKISILRVEKENCEFRLKTSEQNYDKLKINFDELAVAHKNLVDFKDEEKIKINERIMDLNVRLDFLGKRFVKR